MIVKSFELKKLDIKKYNFFLLYGNNKGLIEETLNNFIKPLSEKNFFIYEETEIIKNIENFEETISNKSFFEDKKIIIIRRTSDKIHNFFEKIIEKNLDDILFVLISEILEKKSKLRILFEKNKKTICVPFYEDNQQSLNLLAQNFLKKKKIFISQENINLIIERCNSDRINLYNELSKIENFSLNKKKIETEDILRLTNLSENISFNDLINNTLAKNKKKTLHIINENNFASEDSILILRILINKLKRLLKIQSDIRTKNNNLEKAISDYKPPIFWKEKDMVKRQIKAWDFKELEKLIYQTTDVEKIVKKNPTISTNIVTDFLIEQTNN